jgi:hypothetical protein
MTIRDLPDTTLVREARRLAEASLTGAVLAHSFRTFLCGQAYAEARAISFDEEGLCVAALFHDLGLSRRFADRTRAFTEISARLLTDFLRVRDAGEGRSSVLAEAIELHMQILPRWSRGPEVGLLQVGAWMDVMGLRARSLDRRLRREIQRSYPRGAFGSEFGRSLVESIGSFRAWYRLLMPTARSGPRRP